MPYVPVKCTSCGGKIQLDDQKEFGYCVHCGTKVIYQDAVQKMKVEMSGTVSIEGIANLEKLLQNAETYHRLGNDKESQSILIGITKNYPEDYRAWWKLAVMLAPADIITVEELDRLYGRTPAGIVTHGSDEDSTILKRLCTYTQYAASVAPPEQTSMIRTETLKWLEPLALKMNKIKESNLEAIKGMEAEISNIEAKQNAAKEKLEKNVSLREMAKIFASVIAGFLLLLHLFNPNWWLLLTIPLLLILIIIFLSNFKHTGSGIYHVFNEENREREWELDRIHERKRSFLNSVGSCESVLERLSALRDFMNGCPAYSEGEPDR